MNRYEIKLGGSGGQGVIMAGVILAEAAALYDSKNAIQTQSYGPESRGGASNSVVIISDEDIDYPKATKVDVLLVLTQEAATKYTSDLKANGILIADEDTVKDLPPGEFNLYKLPILATASEKLGKAIVANMVSLGVILGLTSIVSKESLGKALLSRIPKGTEEINLKAFEAGIELGKSYKSQSLHA